ncbi:MAG: rhodanese-like domain-containing protein [Actinomycetota bacterium]|nr:rhodanese-like domain-containing protein [Actinomycetota bacterium]
MTRRSIDEILDDARAGYQRVDPAQAAALRDQGGLLVDIRPVGLRRRDGEIPAALIVDRNQLEWRLDPASPARLAIVDEATYERPVVLVCDEGYASTLAAVSLHALGLRRATDLIGGFAAWAADGRPITNRGARNTS